MIAGAKAATNPKSKNQNRRSWTTDLTILAKLKLDPGTTTRERSWSQMAFEQGNLSVHRFEAP